MPDRYLQVERLYRSALRLKADQRSAYLEEECGQDLELKREVLEMLAQGATTQKPAFDSGGDAGSEFTKTTPLHDVRALAYNLLASIKRLGKYELQAEIGRGGFGKVFIAWDPVVDRKVAIKVLTAADDASSLARFRNEASFAGKLRHPNIVTIYDFGEEGGLPFIVMELLEGHNLHDLFASRAAFELDQKVSILSQAAAGLHHAHAHGLIHRDVKPGNIMVLPDFTVKLLDFGIVRATQASSARLTRKGAVIGTASYMSPEQLRGSDGDAQGDVFSLGVVAYELVAGVHPFRSSDPANADPMAVMFAIASQEPAPLCQLMPDCPPALEEVVLRSLAKDRDKRYHSAEDIVLDLEPILRDLRRQRAARLLTAAMGKLTENNVETTGKLVREILDLDPGNAAARRLRDSVQKLNLRRSLQARIDGLQSEGRALLADRQFEAARERAESALQLDTADQQSQHLLAEIQSAQEQFTRGEEFLIAARQALAEQNLTSAQVMASRALQADPGNPGAAQLLEEIRQGVEQERERNLRAGLAKAQAYLREGAFEKALSVLVPLRAEHPDPDFTEGKPEQGCEFTVTRLRFGIWPWLSYCAQQKLEDKGGSQGMRAKRSNGDATSLNRPKPTSRSAFPKPGRR